MKAEHVNEQSRGGRQPLPGEQRESWPHGTGDRGGSGSVRHGAVSVPVPGSSCCPADPDLPRCCALEQTGDLEPVTLPSGPSLLSFSC